MICIYCLNKSTTIPNSRPHKKTSQVWRRRKCGSCGRLFTTYERPSLEDVVVVDKKERRAFSLGRLTISIHAAIGNSYTPEESFELARTVEAHLIQRYDISTPLTAGAVAEETYHTLKQFNELCGIQYGALHGLLTSIRRPGRPSVASSSPDDVPSRDQHPQS